MADYPLKQEAAEVQTILDTSLTINNLYPQILSEADKAFVREKIGASAVGDGIKILSHFDTLDELTTAITSPKPGDAFSVGSEVPYNLYIYDFMRESWRNYGPIRANDIKARFAQNIAVPVSAWEEDTTVFPDYSFKARIALTEASGNDFPIIAFAPADAISGNFCPIAYCFDGHAEIWAKAIPGAGITLPAATFIVQNATDTVTGNSTKGITNASGGVATGGIGTEQIANGAITRAKLSKNAVSRVFEAAIGTNWAGSAAPYTQEIAVEGLPDSNRIFAGLDFSDDWETAVKEDEEFNKIVKITATNGNMKVYAEEPTTVQLNVKLTVFTGQGTGGDDDGEGGGSGGGSSGGGVQADWNQTDETAPDFIKNKPFGEAYGDTLTWEIDLDNMAEEDVVAGFMLKISSAIVTAADLNDGCVFQSSSLDVNMEIPAEAFVPLANGILAHSDFFFIFVDESGVGVEVEGLIFPQAGVYTIIEIVNGQLIIPGFNGFIKTEKMDEKFLPDTAVTQITYYTDIYEEPLRVYKKAETITDGISYTEMLTDLELQNAYFSGNLIRLLHDRGVSYPSIDSGNMIFSVLEDESRQPTLKVAKTAPYGSGT